ncbi:MAG: DUF362 domain-containing protein [Acidobacteriota bacterium]
MMGAIRKSRRDFLMQLSAAGSAFFFDVPSFIAQERANGSHSRVCLARDDSIKGVDGSLSREKIQLMLSRSMRKLTDKTDEIDAWKQLFSSDDTVGIKVNCLAGKGLSSNPELILAIVEGLKGIGIREERIIVWDRTNDDLIKAGYSIVEETGSGYRCFGTNGEYDYSLGIVNSASTGSLLSPILSRLCTAIISVPVMKDHDLAGLSGTMKNFYGAIHNPNKYHDNACDPYIADIMTIPHIRNKLRLTICDAISVQYQGGPSYKQRWCWKYNGLLVGTDFVSVDAVAYRLIEDKRKEEGLNPLKGSMRDPVYIRSAEQRKLGRSKLEEIEVVHL